MKIYVIEALSDCGLAICEGIESVIQNDLKTQHCVYEYILHIKQETMFFSCDHSYSVI